MDRRAVRMEKDSMGLIEVPANALYGAQTQRALQNFPISHLVMPRAFLRALGLIKQACALSNQQLGLLDEERAQAIALAADSVAHGDHDFDFPLDIFQTGSGTSTNMNANEVIATLARQHCSQPIHANDHVNKGQSSNDVIPACIHLSAALVIHEQLLPTLKLLATTIHDKAEASHDLVKTGRTHLMDAMPLTVAQELSGWEAQLRSNYERIKRTSLALHQLAIGGTAVGTGVNTHPEFGKRVGEHLSHLTGLPFQPAHNYFAALSSQDAAVAVSGQLKTLATSLLKICNDLRWMNSGPLTGLGEIQLPALQPGSSIMPGKVNPVIPEAVAMVCAQVIGNDTTITVAGQSGNFQLNVMLPVIAYNLLQSLELLANSMRVLAEQAIAGMVFNTAHLQELLDRNPILVTALNNRIGYEKGAEIAKKAYAENRPILEVAKEMTDLNADELAILLDPTQLTGDNLFKRY